MLPYTPHPLALVFYFFVTLIIGVTAQHPLEIFVLLGFVLSVLFLFGSRKELRNVFQLGMAFGVIVMALNIFFNRDGVTILYEGPSLPVYGRIIFTFEAIIFGMMMAVKLFLILAIMKMYALFVPPSTGFSAMSRLMPRGVVTVSIATLFVPRLQRRFTESLQVLDMRGASEMKAGLFSRITALRPVLRMLIATALEDSWKTGESLAARGFGLKKRRSSYREERWRSLDNLFMIFALVIFASGLWQHSTETVEYFPEITAPITSTVILSTVTFILASTSALFLMRRSK